MNDLDQVLFPAIFNLIGGIENIRSKRDGFLEATKAKFNVFTILLSADDEVRLHTRFITALLDGGKDASHGCGTLFLKLFLETLDRNLFECSNLELKPDFVESLPDASNFKSIKKEYHTTSHGNIDILIDFQDAAIAIENKIRAGEQEKQLFRYSEYLESTGKDKKFLFFLTLNGHEASSNQNKPYFKISYRKHIIPWLKLCLEKTYSYPNINAVIAQYKKVVQRLLNNSFEEEDMEEIKKLIEKNPAIVKYLEDINSSILKIKEDYEKLFIESLSPKVPGLKTTSSYRTDKIHLYEINSTNNCLAKNNLRLAIEFNSIFTTNCSFYMGIVNFDPGKGLSEDFNAKIKTIMMALRNNFTFYPLNPSWPAGRYDIIPVGTINLYNALSVSGFVEQLTNKCAEEINKFIEIAEKICTE